MFTIQHLEGDAAKALWRRIADAGDELGKRALTPGAAISKDEVEPTVEPTWITQERTLTQNSSVGASVSAGFTSNKYAGKNTSTATASDANYSPLWTRSFASPNTDMTYVCPLDANNYCTGPGVYKKFDLWKVTGLGCHSHLGARTVHSAWSIIVVWQSDLLEKPSSSADAEYVDGCDDSNDGSGGCEDLHPTDDYTYDPNDPDCGGGGGSSTGSLNCHLEYIYVDVDYGDGTGWHEVWEGWAQVCD